MLSGSTQHAKCYKSTVLYFTTSPNSYGNSSKVFVEPRNFLLYYGLKCVRQTQKHEKQKFFTATISTTILMQCSQC